MNSFESNLIFNKEFILFLGEQCGHWAEFSVFVLQKCDVSTQMVGMEGVSVIDPALLNTVCKRWDVSVCKVSLVI